MIGAFKSISWNKKDLIFDQILGFVGRLPESTFVICGIAGDYCVKSTIQNLLNGNIIPKVFCPGIASIDGGKALSDFIKENKLEKTV